MIYALSLLLWLSEPAQPMSEQVTAVRIETSAQRDVERLGRHVTVRVGEPLNYDEVRRSVQYLFATGEFADVIVERKKVPAGIEIVFRTVPAPRLRLIVVEGDPLLSPGRLRRVTRLRDGEPLWSRRLERAAQDAALDLAETGYLEARVSALTNATSPDGRVVFRIHGGPLTRVEAVRVAGLDEKREQIALRRLHSHAGSAYSRKRAQADTSRLRKWLRETGYWSAAVETRETCHPLENRIALTFDVRTGPPTVLAFRGLTPDGRLKGRAQQLLIESGLRSDALEEVSELLEEDLRKQGFAFAKVTHEQEEGPGSRRIVYTCQRGPLVRVAAVRVEGAPTAELARIVRTRVGQSFRQRQVDDDVQALKRALEERGFATARVDADPPAYGTSTPVMLRIRAGRRLTLASIDVIAPVSLPGTSTQDLGLNVGDPYRPGEVARARDTITATYHNAGYTGATVSVETAPAADGASVGLRFRVDAGPRARLDRILVAGLEHTHEEVVRRELLIREHEPLRWDRVLESHRRLSALGLFRGVTVYELDPDESAGHTLVFAVEEGSRTRLTAGLGAAGIKTRPDAGAGVGNVNPTLRASAEVTRRNLGGLDRDVSVFARFSFRGSRFLTTYHEPYLLGHKTAFSTSLFYEEEERTTFNYDRVGASLQATRSLAPRWNLVARYTFSRTHSSPIGGEVDRQYRDQLSSGPSFSLVNDTRDDPLDPRRGRFLSIDSQFSHRVLGGHGFSKSFLQAAVFQRLRGPLLLAVGLRLGAAWTFGREKAPPVATPATGATAIPGDTEEKDRPQTLDAPDRFYAGGDYSMRGFDADAVAPWGGLSLGVGSVELRCALSRGLSLAAFADVGGVGGVYPEDVDANSKASYSTVPKFSLGDDVRMTAGMGLRYRTPVGPIRVDWAFKLDRRAGEARDRLHVTVGHAF